jgi:hypothetical protein
MYVVKKTIRDIGGAQFPVLTHSNYAEWKVVAKVMLKACGLWKAVSIGTDDEEKDQFGGHPEGCALRVPRHVGLQGFSKRGMGCLEVHAPGQRVDVESEGAACVL